MNLHLDEMIRRNSRKTPEERVETLMAALREVEARGLWPRIDRKAKEQRILCSIRAKSSRGSTATGSNMSPSAVSRRRFTAVRSRLSIWISLRRLTRQPRSVAGGVGGHASPMDVPLTDAVLQRQPMFALNTAFGDLDILSEVLGVGSYEQAMSRVESMKVGGVAVPILDLTTLIATKEAAADPNPRKRSALEYLKALQQRGRQH